METVAFSKRNFAPYVSPILDSGTLALVCKDLGLTGRAIPKVIKGRQYIAFSGYAGLRSLYPGTLYSAKNRKIIKMGIGSLGIKNMVARGGTLTIYLTVPLTVLEAFLSDNATCYDLAGELADDIIKIGISTLVTGIAGALVGVLYAYGAVSIGVAIILGVFTGEMLNALSNQNQWAVKLSGIFEDMVKQIEQSAKNKIHDVQTGAYRSLSRFIRLQGYGGPF